MVVTLDLNGFKSSNLARNAFSKSALMIFEGTFRVHTICFA